jgi:2-polyprenyl-3-methyl-5-hydroxy-6-metoxy-1,4-benzoquinol methylase
VDHVSRRCWCGAESLEEFGGGYLHCTSCHTLVGQYGLTSEETLVRDDETDFYGRQYWLEHQPDDLGLPDIDARARFDLAERCARWLETLLRYRRPPARILELGAGHGAYTALLRWAGFDATALDLSPWVAEFARERFSVPYLVGKVEDQDLEERSFDVVVANDVLEHLDDPLRTMRRCVELLKPAGLLVIQTPDYPYPRSHTELELAADLFLTHMQRPAREHLYLFSREAMKLLTEKLGLAEVVFEEPPFPYDMLCLASAAPLPERDGDVGALVGASPASPLVLALIDANAAWRRSESDRANRLEVIERLDKALAESEHDRQARLETIEQLDTALAVSERDRQARLETIEQLDTALTVSERDRQARLEVIERLGGMLAERETPTSASSDTAE